MFNWQAYISNYPDLQKAGICSEQQAVKHYTTFGKTEGRTDTPNAMINDTSVYINGLLGNVLFCNIVCDYIAKKSNIKIKYSKHLETKTLGIQLYSGNVSYSETCVLDDKNIDLLFTTSGKFLESKNILIDSYFHTPIVAEYLNGVILKNKNKIISANPYSERYQNNSDLFIHVRFNDIPGPTNIEPYEYYSKAISMVTFQNGYIASDNLTHPICRDLIKNFKLTPFNASDTKIIQYGSTCKNIILSKGTLSWFIGVFSFGNSNVYFPERLNKKNWHGHIFIFPEWNKVNY